MTRGPHQLRVASYNVHGIKDDRGAVIEVIRAIAPDILLLQEVPRHPLSGHRLANFGAELGLTWFGGARYRMSTTLMTSLRVDVLQARHGRLPVRRFDEPRGYALAEVRLPGHRPVTAVGVHLSLRPDDRMREVHELLGEVDPETSQVVLGGDLNDEPTGAAWRLLEQHLQLLSGSAPTYSTRTPHKRIDAIFGPLGSTARVPDLELDPARLLAASDHLPVVVDLDLAVG